jgi:hypothetical protein
MQNLSQPGPGATGWSQGSTAAFTSQSGAPNSYIAANYDNGTGTSTLSNWLLTPPVTLQNGATMTFWTRTVNTPSLPDRLQVRMSTNGASTNTGTVATDLGDFTTLMLDINPTYTVGYPNVDSVHGDCAVRVAHHRADGVSLLCGERRTGRRELGLYRHRYRQACLPDTDTNTNTDTDTDTDQYIGHYLLLYESGSGPVPNEANLSGSASARRPTVPVITVVIVPGGASP